MFHSMNSMTRTHPEIREGEIWVTNITLEGFDKCNHKTKRLGEIAYDVWGKPVIGFYPMFAIESELNSKGFIFPKLDNVLDLSNYTPLPTLINPERINMSNRERVSEDVRRANARAIADRTKWRKNYTMLTSVIRDLKQKVANSPDAVRPKFELAVMQSFASFMMDVREEVAEDLKNTAYEWVE